MPKFVLDKLAIDDEDGGKKKKHVDRESEIPAEAEETQFKKALSKWEESDMPPPGEFAIVVLVECCLHLPISDQPLKDPYIVGSCDGE